MITEHQKPRNLKVHTISAADLATLESDLNHWLSAIPDTGAGETEDDVAPPEATIVGIEFETAASSDNRAYILYTE